MPRGIGRRCHKKTLPSNAQDGSNKGKSLIHLNVPLIEIPQDSLQYLLERSNPDYNINIFWGKIMLSKPESLISMKRIEIVIHEEFLDDLLKLFRDANVHGYTVIKKAGGLGSTGERDQDDFIMEQYNAVMLLVCEENQAEKLVTMLHPKLKDFGGMCLVSDCQRVLVSSGSY